MGEYLVRNDPNRLTVVRYLSRGQRIDPTSATSHLIMSIVPFTLEL